MHVAIERAQLRLTHFHPVSDIVGGLAYLEGAKFQIVYFDSTTSPQFLDSFTDLELRQLYRNTTLSELPANFDSLQARDALATLFESLTPQHIDADELRAQIDEVLDELEKPVSDAMQFKYVHGAQVPQVIDGGLFPLSTAPLTPSQLAESAQLALQRRKPRAAVTAQAQPVLRLAPKRSERTIATPKGGIRLAIWAHADKVWEEAGKPINKGLVLELRKRMMNELEEQGIKRSTSSTTLGDWMKTRLSET